MKFTTKTKWVLFLTILIVAAAVLYFYGQRTLSEQLGQKPSPTPITAASGNIIISSPAPQEAVSQKFRVLGQVKSSPNELALRVKHKLTGKSYLETSAPGNTQSTGSLTEFVYEAELTPDPSLRPGDELVLEVFQRTTDGKELDMVTIPLIFTPLIEEGS